ncbi:hypothetical protein K9L16_04045, partial [Candidatus Pacearchaeota archaeon]|nr:hypothetical protein [Candidatus Pacearchaeota archaeon]
MYKYKETMDVIFKIMCNFNFLKLHIVLILKRRKLMYELNKIQPILYHLDHISNIFADKGSHYSMFCPFCNDATRKNNPQHGHCYVSKNLP